MNKCLAACALLLSWWLSSCHKNDAVQYIPPPIDTTVQRSYFSFNRVDLYCRPGIAGDTTKQIYYAFSFRQVVNIYADTVAAHDSIVKNFETHGAVQLGYRGLDSLFLTDSLKRFSSSEVDYRLSKRLVGKVLFEGFEMTPQQDTTRHYYFIPAGDSVRISVFVSAIAPGVTPQKITAGFNSLLHAKLDTTFFYWPDSIGG